MGSTRRIIGGLMKGLGAGVVAAGQEKREAALAEIEHNRNLQRDSINHGFAMEERTFSADRDDSRQKNSQDFTAGESDKDRAARLDLENTQYELNEKGANNQLGRDKDLAGYKDGLDAESGGLSVKDKRTIDALKEQYKDENGEVDIDGLAGHLKSIGRKDLADFVNPDAGDGTVNLDDPAWTEAKRQAEAEASDQAGTFSSDASDFKDDGGNRSKFVNRRTKAIYDGLKGKASPKAGAAEEDAPDKTTPPSEYPDAKWSDKAGGWVVKRNGKWFQVDDGEE